MRMTRKQRDDVLLSYIVGLGPFGEPVCCHVSYLRADMGWDHQSYYLSLNRLIRSGRIRRFACGMYIALARPE